MPNRAAILKQQFRQSVGLLWQDILPTSRLEAILSEAQMDYRNCVYKPNVTLWAMISQVRDPDKSLSNAVQPMITGLSLAGCVCPSADTGA